MGVFGLMKNNKKKPKSRKAMKWRRDQRKTARQNLPPTELNLEDVQLMSKEMLKKKMKNMKTNVTLSNKKKNRITKRLRHRAAEKEREEAAKEEEMADDTNRPSTSKASKKSKKSKPVATTTMEVDSE